ncbi:MAG: RsmB/NOP family class I SAM-dependent RNA methyltransferase [Polyangia bacterium]
MLDPGGPAGQIGTALSAPPSGSLSVAARPQTLARLSGGARALALEIAAESRAEWGYASDIIARAFRAHRELGSSERRKIAETIYGLIRFDRRLDKIVDEMLAAAGRGGAGVQAKAKASGWAVAHSPIDFSPIVRDELKLIVFELREGLPGEAVTADVRRLVRGDLDLDLAQGPDAGLGKAAGAEREAIRLSVPTWLFEKLAAERGQEAAAGLIDAMNQRAPLAIRVNTALTTRDKLIDELAEEGVTARPGRWTPTALVLETRVNAFGLSAFRRGLFEVMDEGSQVVAELVAPPPGGRVLDACAGAGGKTLALAASLAGKGRVLAIDVDGKKLEELRRRARRAGLNNVTARVIGKDGAELPAEARPSGWDRVLVDAPCSGLGTLRRNPEARWRMRPSTVAEFPPRQMGLLVTYAPLVAVGGRLIYATCTVMGDENERVVEQFLAERDDFVRVPVKEIWGRARAEELSQGEDGFLRLSPALHDTDGFFAAVMRRVR